MTIAEMEPMIDRLNLLKLEVKMAKGRQVHFFICADKGRHDEEGETHYRSLVVFDKNGKCWTVNSRGWKVGQSFRTHDNVSPEGEVKALSVDDEQGHRYPKYDLSL